MPSLLIFCRNKTSINLPPAESPSLSNRRGSNYYFAILYFDCNNPTNLLCNTQALPSSSPHMKELHWSQCCDYQTVDCKSLNFHIQTQHPMTMKPSKNESLTKGKSTGCNLNRCQHCDFTTLHKRGLRKHTEHHLKSFGLQCPKCSYSVGILVHLTRHIKYHHLGDLEPNFSTDNGVINVFSGL